MPSSERHESRQDVMISGQLGLDARENLRMGGYDPIEAHRRQQARFGESGLSKGCFPSKDGSLRSRGPTKGTDVWSFGCHARVTEGLNGRKYLSCRDERRGEEVQCQGKDAIHESQNNEGKATFFIYLGPQSTNKRLMHA